MINHATALRYSRALFEFDIQKELAHTRLKEFKFFLDLLAENEKLAQFLKAPQIDLIEKEKFLKSLIGDQLTATFINFLLLLVEKNRFSSLTQIAAAYRAMMDEHLGIWEASITTAKPLEKDLEEKLKQKLEGFYHKKVYIKNEINPQIMGGAILVVGNQMIDWSVASRLKKIKENLLESL